MNFSQIFRFSLSSVPSLHRSFQQIPQLFLSFCTRKSRLLRGHNSHLFSVMHPIMHTCFLCIKLSLSPVLLLIIHSFPHSPQTSPQADDLSDTTLLLCILVYITIIYGFQHFPLFCFVKKVTTRFLPVQKKFLTTHPSSPVKKPFKISKIF